MKAHKKTNSMQLTKRCMMAAQLFDFILKDNITALENVYKFVEDTFPMEKESEKIAYQLLEGQSKPETIMEWIQYIDNMSTKSINQFADQLLSELIDSGLVEIAPSLLENDFYYRSAGVEIKEYRSSCKQYHIETEGLKAETLEEGEISDNTLCLLWLLKQDGDLKHFLSNEEISKLQDNIARIFRENTFGHQLYACHMKGNATRGLKTLASIKNEVMKSQFGVGAASRLPFIHRREGIFIETKEMFPNANQRVEAVKSILESNGHICEVKSFGAVSLVEIDNVLYELFPDAIATTHISVHGVRLRRYVIL